MGYYLFTKYERWLTNDDGCPIYPYFHLIVIIMTFSHFTQSFFSFMRKIIIPYLFVVKKFRRNIINTAYLHIINADNNILNNLVENEVINIIIFVVNFLLKPHLNVIIMYASYYELQYII